MTPPRLAIGWAVLVVLALSLPMPGTSMPSSFPTDKVVHAVLFLGVGWLWARATPERLLAVVLGGLALAIGTEVLQGVLPFDRTMDAADALADAIGLALGVGAARIRQQTE